jgi:hypothetical protein
VQASSPTCEAEGSAAFSVPPSIASQDNALYVRRHVFDDATAATYDLSVLGDPEPITIHDVCGLASFDEEELP